MQPRQAKVVKRPPTFHRICRNDPTADATKAQHSVKYTCKNQRLQGKGTIIQHFDKHGETELFKLQISPGFYIYREKKGGQ